MSTLSPILGPLPLHPRATVQAQHQRRRDKDRMDGAEQVPTSLTAARHDSGKPGSNNAGETAEQQRQAHADTCSICLETLSERAIAYPCNHVTFDFICLVSWLQEQDTCPLCKAKVLEVQYDWRSPSNYKTYQVPSPRQPSSRSTTGSLSERRTRHTSQTRHRASRLPTAPNSSPLTLHDPALERRKHIYRHRLFTLYVGSNTFSGYTNFTPSTVAGSAILQSRARAFLRRELRVFGFLDTLPTTTRRSNTREFLVEYVVSILRTMDLRASDSRAEELVAGFLGRENARLLLHELEAWLRGPFSRLEEWDRDVQYMDQKGVFLLRGIDVENGQAKHGR